MAENVVAGSVPMATATSSREPFRLPIATCGKPADGAVGNGDRAAGRLRHCRYTRGERIGIRRGCRRIAQCFAIMLRGNFLALPVHAGSLAVVDLHAVHADIALARSRVAGMHAGQRDEAASIVRPALEDRKLVQIEVVFPALSFDFRITSLQRASLALTVLGNALVRAPSCGSILSLSRRPSGAFMFIRPLMRSAISSSRSTPRASAMRRSLPNWLMRTLWPGWPLMFSNSSAGPPGA